MVKQWFQCSCDWTRCAAPCCCCRTSTARRCRRSCRSWRTWRRWRRSTRWRPAIWPFAWLRPSSTCPLLRYVPTRRRRVDARRSASPTSASSVRTRSPTTASCAWSKTFRICSSYVIITIIIYFCYFTPFLVLFNCSSSNSSSNSSSSSSSSSMSSVSLVV